MPNHRNGYNNQWDFSFFFYLTTERFSLCCRCHYRNLSTELYKIVLYLIIPKKLYPYNNCFQINSAAYVITEKSENIHLKVRLIKVQVKISFEILIVLILTDIENIPKVNGFSE